MVLSGRGAGDSRVPFNLCKEYRSFSLNSCAIFKFNSLKCRTYQRNFASVLCAITFWHVQFLFQLFYLQLARFLPLSIHIYIFDYVYSGGGRCLRLSGVLLCVASKHRGSVAAESLWPVARWL